MVAEPPYGVEYDAEWREKVHGAAAAPRSTGAVANDDRFDWSDAFRLFPGNVFARRAGRPVQGRPAGVRTRCLSQGTCACGPGGNAKKRVIRTT